MKQLDLFDIPEPVVATPNGTTAGAPPDGAAIIPFPQCRNIGRVRHVAGKLNEREGRALESYWRRSINDLASMLLRAGLSNDQVEAQILTFRDAVGAELYRLDCGKTPQQPGGAA